MSADREKMKDVEAGAAHFATTQWSIVLAAGSPCSAKSACALESLCETYWYPLYGYVRRRVPDLTKLQKTIGTMPSMPLGEILDDIIAWKREQRRN